MSLREKREARRARENEILKQMAEENAVREDGKAVENAAAEESREAEGEAAADAATSEGMKKPADETAGPSYTPMTDEQIRKVRLILWPILLVAAILVYFLMRSCKG